jgi:signal transduction histidine kinase
MSHLLHPPLSDEAGLASALRWYVDGFSERSEIEVKLHIRPTLGGCPMKWNFQSFESCRSVTNIRRHAESPTSEFVLPKTTLYYG